MVGVEALIRWNHRQRGILSPAEFVSVAEEDGLIVPIGGWVMMSAMSTLRSWLDMGINPVCVAVNVADKQFKETNFVSKIKQAIELFDIPTHFVKIELTEGIIMDQPDEAIQKLKELKALGVKISIDDFGTGYSSLSYLKKFPIDQFKIDRSFVKDLGGHHRDNEITTAMIAMGQALNIEIIAEGVESKEQLQFLKDRGCFFIQGFFYSKPLPEENITQILVQGGQFSS
jgi:EAL domain-containing protein (putative c-di-GMP-specific phosphodiesterase class I)